jgi:hypothetical protein
MTTPRYDEVEDRPVSTDEDLLDRVEELLVGACRRQFWLMFLDERDRQLPVLMPCDVPPRPDAKAAKLGSFIRELGRSMDAAAVITVLERRGGPMLRDGDREWMRALDTAMRDSELRPRGPLLCFDDGVRWVAAEDYLV